MTLTSSGQISINDINGEFGRSGRTANRSLKELSVASFSQRIDYESSYSRIYQASFYFERVKIKN